MVLSISVQHKLFVCCCFGFFRVSVFFSFFSSFFASNLSLLGCKYIENGGGGGWGGNLKQQWLLVRSNKIRTDKRLKKKDTDFN